MQQLCALLGWTIGKKAIGAAANAAPIHEEPLEELPDGVTHQTFKHYVHHKDDLIGFVAYSIYKQHKITFLAREFRDTQQAATQEKVDAFCAAYGNPDQVSLLRNQAEALLGHMNAALVSQKEAEITVRKHSELIEKYQKGPGWWRTGLQGMFGNLLTAAIISFFAILALTSQHGIMGAGATILGYKITPIERASTPQPNTASTEQVK